MSPRSPVINNDTKNNVNEIVETTLERLVEIEALRAEAEKAGHGTFAIDEEATILQQVMLDNLPKN